VDLLLLLFLCLRLLHCDEDVAGVVTVVKAVWWGTSGGGGESKWGGLEVSET